VPVATTTFVIATYKRVEALRCTLQSVILQENHDWTALVIGDNCGPETGEMIRGLGEPRIRYYNLPARCGEQSGPNTFGLGLASADYVAFLNHDDLLLRDHLTHALDRICSTRSDFFIGRLANATLLRDEPGGAVAPIFTQILPKTEDLSYLVTPQPWLFEPSSLWLVRTAYAKTVGAWQPARNLWRTPLRDWLMRAWRLGGKFCFGERITGARFWTQNLRQPPLYSHTTAEHDYMLERIRCEPSATLGKVIEQEIAAHRQAVAKGRKGLSARSMTWSDSKRRLSARLYRKTGIDLYNLENRLRRSPRGALMNELSKKRTGQPLKGLSDIQGSLRNAEDFREV